MALGKIKNMWIGSGGYQNAQFGITFLFETSEGSVMDFWTCGWNMEPGEHAKWTNEDRLKSTGDVFNRLRILMKEISVTESQGLIGKPVEVFFAGQTLGSWRILKEVL